MRGICSTAFNFQTLVALFCVLLVCMPKVFAATTVTESFTSRSNLDDAGGMVWNQALGELHPPLQAFAWHDNILGGPNYTPYSVGDGHDGAFISSRYHLFDVDGVVTANVIEINTDVYTDLQFTEFNLLATYTIRPVGSNPLVIRSLSDMIINGTIDCSGEAGDDAVADINTIVSGGAGHCGGGDGGDSVAPAAVPGVSNKGTSGGTGVTGGDGGQNSAGGGGGGSFILNKAVLTDYEDPTAGANTVGGTGGAPGFNNRDDPFDDDIDGAGSGGGGGSAYNTIGDEPNHSSGAGGGAGGGNMRFYVVRDITVGATGYVRANGGSGGSVAGGLKGGGGGGGGGGSILMFAGNDIIFSAHGIAEASVTARAGSGGTTTGGDGGTGAWGRTWVLDSDVYAAVIAPTLPEEPETRLDTPGDIRYETPAGTYTVTSKAIELGNTRPFITNTSLNGALAGGTAVFNLAFSESSALASLAAFALHTTFLNTEVKRFARFQLIIDNNLNQNPIRIHDLSLTFDGATQKDFEFSTGCGGSDSSASLASREAYSLFLLLPFLLIFYLRRRFK